MFSISVFLSSLLLNSESLVRITKVFFFLKKDRASVIFGGLQSVRQTLKGDSWDKPLLLMTSIGFSPKIHCLNQEGLQKHLECFQVYNALSLAEFSRINRMSQCLCRGACDTVIETHGGNRIIIYQKFSLTVDTLI